jgi:hypothetical protein
MAVPKGRELRNARFSDIIRWSTLPGPYPSRRWLRAPEGASDHSRPGPCYSSRPMPRDDANELISNAALPGSPGRSRG